MRTIKTSAISMLTAGLLAGSAIGVVAQDEEAAGPSTPTESAACTTTTNPDPAPTSNRIVGDVSAVPTRDTRSLSRQ